MLGQELPELRLAQLPLEELARVRVDQIDATLLEALMELAHGKGFATLLALLQPAERSSEDDDGRAEGEARDETMNNGLHGELNYQRSYLPHFATNIQ